MVIFFDLDGTLIDPLPRLYELHKEILRTFYLNPLARKLFYSLKRSRVCDEDIVSNYFAAHITTHYIRKRNALIEHRDFLLYDEIKPGVLATLKLLMQEHKLSLITARKKRANLLCELNNLGIRSFFENIISGSKKNGIIKKREETTTVIVGDTEEDIALGRRCNFITIAITDGMRYSSYLQTLQPDYLIKNISETCVVLRRIDTTHR